MKIARKLKSVKKRTWSKRRSRKNNKQDINYICFCGKTYFTQTGLKQHTRLKHSQQSATSLISQNNQDHQEQKQQIQLITQIDFPINKHLQQLVEFISEYFPLSKDKKIHQDTFSLNQIPQKYSSMVKRILSQKENDSKTKQLAQNGTKFITIDSVFAQFIYQTTPYLSARGQKFMTWFIISFKTGICSVQKDNKYCEVNSAYGIPLFFNQLPFNYIPIYAKYEQFLLNNTLICKVLFYFGQWLFEERYTNLSAKFTNL